MFDFEDLLFVHEKLFAHYNNLVGRLSDEQMAVQSLCPDWDVRGVITHAIGAEFWVTGWQPSATQRPPFERMAEFEARARSATRAEFARMVADVTTTRLQELREMKPEVLELPALTPAGRATYGRMLRIRVFDLWVHACDIAIPLGEPLNDSGIAAELVLDEVSAALGFVIGKKVGLPDGMSVAFRIRGTVKRDIVVLVDGRASVTNDIDSPDIEISTDLVTFVMLAAGRIDPQTQVTTGKLQWSGNTHWATQTLTNLAYTP